MCPYTAEGVTPVPTTTYNYEYNNSSWGDQLTRFGGGSNMLYDGIGNPILYSNGATNSYIMTWTAGRRLSSVQKGSSMSSYGYNGDGVRVYKYAEGRDTYYFVEGTRIIYELRGSDILYYLYDADGSPIGMKYLPSSGIEPITYYYEKNIQGDIVGIRDVYGRQIASYVYDAWGNFTATYYDSAQFDEIVLRNPYLYRGYYYDYETGFYYLNSRYYDPTTGRFINADGLLNQGSLLGNNMYAYCLNNPANMADTTGQLPFFLVTAAIGAVAGAVIGGVVAAKNGGNVWAGVGVGAAAGALIGTGAGMAAGAALAGSLVATTAHVAAGASTLVTTVAAGGLGAGATYIANNLSQACNEISNATSNAIHQIAHKASHNPGKPFVPGKTGFQFGVDPNTLTPTKNLASLSPQRIADAVKYGGDHAVIVGRTGRILDGHHRVADAILSGRAIDVFVQPFR